MTATCTPAGQKQTNQDSQQLRALQVAGSQVVAQTSGAAISGAVDGAIVDALGGNSGGGSGSGSQQANLGGPRPLGLGEQPQTVPTYAPNSLWHPWASVRGSHRSPLAKPQRRRYTSMAYSMPKPAADS